MEKGKEKKSKDGLKKPPSLFEIWLDELRDVYGNAEIYALFKIDSEGLIQLVASGQNMNSLGVIEQAKKIDPAYIG